MLKTMNIVEQVAEATRQKTMSIVEQVTLAQVLYTKTISILEQVAVAPIQTNHRHCSTGSSITKTPKQ